MGTPAPDAVKRLVDLSACSAQADHFDQNRKACPELGGRVAGATKAPDYTFRIGGLSACSAQAGRRHRTGLGTRTPLTFGLYAVTFRLYCEVNYGHN
jgi:hypothetical protein